MNNENKVEVTIFSQTFEILSSEVDKTHLKELASFVDLRMKETFKSTNLSSVLKVAVLTALNLAEELFNKEINKENNFKGMSVNNIKESDVADTIIKISNRINAITNYIENYEEEKEV